MSSRTAFFALFATVTLVGCQSSSRTSSTPTTTTKEIAAPSGVAMSKTELSTKEGVPIYPGSVVPEGKSTVTPSDTETRYSLIMETNDPISKIVDFYNSKIPGLSVSKSSDSADLIGQTPNGTLAHIKIGTKDGKSTIEAVSIVESTTQSSSK